MNWERQVKRRRVRSLVGALVGTCVVALAAEPSALGRRPKSKSGHSSDSSHRSHRTKEKPTDAAVPSEPTKGDGSTDSPAEVRLKPRVQALLGEAKAALASGDLDGAQKKAESAFKKQSSPEALFVLGQVAYAQRQMVEAQDIFRRYLADPSTTIDPAKRIEAQRNEDKPLPPLGDLYVIGDKDSLVYVNERLLGSLPLVLPLRVAAGNLSVALSSGGRTTKGKVEVPGGQAREIRFDALTGAVLVSVPPTVVFAQDSGTSLEGEPGLVAALEKGSQLVGYTPAFSNRKLSVCGTLAPDCLLDAARQHAAGFTLAVKVTPVVGGKEFQLSLWDAQVGEVAAQESARCVPCSEEGQLSSLAQQVAAVLRRGRNRPRGVLSVSSIPSEAQVLLAGRFVGQTPWKGPVFVGPQQIELSVRGFERQQLFTTVTPGQTAVVSSLLVPELITEPLPRGEARPLAKHGSRPLWRITTGAAVIGAGILMIGLGGSGLASDGSCVPPLMPPAQVCRETIHSGTIGGSLLGVGLGLSIGGVVLIAIPPSGASGERDSR